MILCAMTDRHSQRRVRRNQIIEEGTKEHLAGKSRPAEELLDELTREAQDDAAGGREI